MQISRDAHELGNSHHNPLTLTAMQQANITVEHPRATAQLDTGRYLNTTGIS